jgi:hypothetical protein
VFPGIVQQVARTPSVPGCLLCHTNPSGGLGTANTAFATYLRSRGLRAGDEASLRGALGAMVGEKHDTDGDGTPDADELAAGEDPNGEADTSIEPVAYGCGAHVAPASAPFAAPWAVVAAALSILLRRRARR